MIDADAGRQLGPTGLRKPDPDFFPVAVVNATNWCTLACEHCFVYREGNPNDPGRAIGDEPSDDDLLAELAALAERHRFGVVLWMGGEPLLKPELLRRGTARFDHNIVTTNGTISLLPLERTHYVISLDGPPAVNDAIRGRGSFRKVMRTLRRLPATFTNTVQAQCTVTRQNQDHLDELVEILQETPIAWMTFSFYVPSYDDHGPNTWPSLGARDEAVERVVALKERYPGFVRNSTASLRLLRSDLAPTVTGACPSKALVLPLYLGPHGFEQPYCCYGNDVDCDRCGAWVVFHLAGKLGYLAD